MRCLKKLLDSLQHLKVTRIRYVESDVQNTIMFRRRSGLIAGHVEKGAIKEFCEGTIRLWVPICEIRG
jgi:hypothetical protein